MKWKWNHWFAAACVFAAALVLIISVSGHASVVWKKRLYFGTQSPDSVHRVLYTNYDSISSTLFTGVGISLADSITLDETQYHQIWYIAWWYGDTFPSGYEYQFYPVFDFQGDSVIAKGGLIDSVGAVDTVIGGQGYGSGDHNLSILVLDTTGGGSTPVTDIPVTFKNWPMTATERTRRTDENGIALIATFADSLAFRATATRYTFPTAYDSNACPGDSTCYDTIYGYRESLQPVDSPQYVNAYVYIGTPEVDSAAGTVIPRDDLRLFLDLKFPGGHSANDGNWIYTPRQIQARPDADGLAQFTIIANTVLSPEGSYYILRYTGRDGRTALSGTIRHFIVDTTSDPVNILDCTEAPY